MVDPDDAVLDPFSPEYWQDIHGVTGALRERWPVVRSTLGGVEVLRWDDGEPLLHDPRLHQALLGMLTRQGIEDGPLHSWWQLLMNNHDAPTHTRLRSLVGRAFTPRRVEQVRPRIRQVADQLVAETIARTEGGTEIDVLDGLCNRLPLVVLCELLGMEPEQEAVVAEWTTLVAMAFSPVIPTGLRADIERAIVEFDAYSDELIDRRRAEPTDDLLGALVAAEEAGDRLSRAELRALIINLLFAGHDTTRSLLSIGLWLLATHPDQYRLLRDTPGLVSAALEEICRFESPISGIPRIPDTAIEIAGTTVEVGSIVTISVPAAHRDPRRFEHPDRFDVTRTDLRHLTFGHGVHHCIGAAVARAEVREALASVVQGCAALHTSMDVPAWMPFAATRRFASLPFSLQSA